MGSRIATFAIALTLGGAARAQLAETELVASDGSAHDSFGMSVALSDRFAFVGSPRDDDDGTNSGAVYVFERIGATWTEADKLTLPFGSGGDRFGRSVAVGTTRLIVGAHLDDTSEVDTGSAYVYRLQGGQWILEERLVASDAGSGDAFGVDVDMNDQRALVGANAGAAIGAAYVFERSGPAWSESAKLVALDAAPSSGFGFAVALGNDVALVGAPSDDAIAPNAGAVYVFEPQGGTWVQTAKLSATDTGFGDRFGRALDLSRARCLVGARGDTNFVGPMAGAAYVFDLVAGTWTESAKLIGSNVLQGTMFGHAVALDGDRALIGAPLHNFTGTATLFELRNRAWTQVSNFKASDTVQDDDFGDSVALAGGRALIGASSDDDLGTNAGSTYVFDLDCCVPYCTSKVNSDGCAARISGDGAPSPTANSIFAIAATDVVAARNGLLFYGLSGAVAIDFLGGTLCVASPLRRTPLQNSGGLVAVPCDGTLTFDFNAWIQAGNAASATIGTPIHAQYWYRDPADAFGVGLTDGLMFQVGP